MGLMGNQLGKLGLVVGSLWSPGWTVREKAWIPYSSPLRLQKERHAVYLWVLPAEFMGGQSLSSKPGCLLCW